MRISMKRMSPKEEQERSKHGARRNDMATLNLPEHDYKIFCLATLWQISDYFEDPEHMAAFEEWKKERKKNERKQKIKRNTGDES